MRVAELKLEPLKPRKKKAGETARVNIEIAPGVARRLNAYLDREKQSGERTKASLTYTEIINDALSEFLNDQT